MNCLSRSIAYLLGEPVDQVPDLAPLVGSTRAYWARVDEWLHARGLARVWIEDPRQARSMRGSYIVLMRDAAAGWHAVVYRDGELEYDPSGARATAFVAGVLLVYPLRIGPGAGRGPRGPSRQSRCPEM